MRVAMVVSEMTPFAKTGGLADVAGALPEALGKLGLEVHVFLPRYAQIRESRPRVAICRGVTVHFIDHEPFFNRAGLYGDSSGDYPDNLERFAFFCRKVLVRIKEEGIPIHLLHAHDWQGALAAVYLKTLYRNDPFFSETKTVFTIHNLAYQGVFSRDQYPKLELPWKLFGVNGLEFYDKVNLLKGGLLFSDCLTTVSPTYSKEIQTLELGAGLDGVLRMRANDLVGILNGIDVNVWNPATDAQIGFRYDEGHLKEKVRNKEALQKELGLPINPKAFLVGMVNRLASQKGLDLVMEVIPRLSGLAIQWAILGQGEDSIQQALRKTLDLLPHVRLELTFDDALAHRIYAGADAFLMPSHYEPCGLGQMIAMRYGTVPIVRATGGLNDTIVDASNSHGTGFSFGPYSAPALADAVSRALRAYGNPAVWEGLIRRGMSADFSWNESALKYLRLYEKLVSCSSLA